VLGQVFGTRAFIPAKYFYIEAKSKYLAEPVFKIKQFDFSNNLKSTLPRLLPKSPDTPTN
jgi:hypothetical protein